jgi:hypothetical protein
MSPSSLLAQHFTALGLPTELERPLEGESFVRIEDKFVAPRVRLPQLLATLRAEVPRAAESGRQGSHVESCYFDSPDLYTLRTHFSGEASRFKLRMRRYAPPSSSPASLPSSLHTSADSGSGTKFNDREPSYLELKVKENGISRKHRFLVGPEDCQALFRGEALDLSDELCALNAKLKAGTLLKRVGAVNYKIGEFGLIPMARVSYRREAFETRGLRVTVDHDMRCSMLEKISDASRVATCSDRGLWNRIEEMGKRYRPESDVIVEIKHAGQIPNWLLEALSAGGFEKISFSKYVFSVYCDLSQGRRYALSH